MSQKWKVLLAFAGIFVAGAIAGGVVALRVEKERAAATAAEKERVARDKDAGKISPQLMGQLTSQLALDKAQKERIQPIIDQTAEKIATLNQDYREATQDYREETMKLREEMEHEISGLLSAEQRKKLADGQAKRTEQFNTRFTRPPGPGDFSGGNGPAGRRGGGRGFDPGNQTASSPFGPGAARQGRDPGGRRGGPPGSASNSAPTAPAAGRPTQ